MARIRAERLKTSSFKLFLILISFMINSDCATELGLFVTVSRHPHQRAQASQKATTRSGSTGEWYMGITRGSGDLCGSNAMGVNAFEVKIWRKAK